MTDLFDNPLGTRGFAYLEYADAGEGELRPLFERLGFTAAFRHKSRPITVMQQGDIRFLLVTWDEGQPRAFRDVHTRGASAMAFLVDDAAQAFAGAVARGATPAARGGLWQTTVEVPAIEAIGGTVISLLDRPTLDRLFAEEFEPIPGAGDLRGVGLTYIDHLTHNLHRGNMNKWAAYYESIFNFREIRYFDIEGKLTGLLSKAMTSPDGNIRIPLNESRDDKSQIEEFLKRYNGEGIQHIALGTDNIYETVEALRARGAPFQDTPETYFEQIPTRVPGHGEDLARLQKNRILIDGAPGDTGLLLQIFTQDAIGPIFFEIIQRKGNQGFGEGNFKALFESIELDQIRRGVLKAAEA